MVVIKLSDRVIYRAEVGKKVKHLGDNKLYSEIAVKEETDQIIEVVEGEENVDNL